MKYYRESLKTFYWTQSILTFLCGGITYIGIKELYKSFSESMKISLLYLILSLNSTHTAPCTGLKVLLISLIIFSYPLPCSLISSFVSWIEFITCKISCRFILKLWLSFSSWFFWCYVRFSDSRNCWVHSRFDSCEEVVIEISSKSSMLGYWKISRFLSQQYMRYRWNGGKSVLTNCLMKYSTLACLSFPQPPTRN